MFFLFFAFFLLLFQPVHDQRFEQVEGDWSGAIQVYEEELKINVLFTYSDGELDGTLNIPQQQAFNLPLIVTRAEGDEVVFEFQTGSGPAIFYGIWDPTAQTIEGEFEQVGERFPFSLMKQPVLSGTSRNIPEIELMIPTTGGVISGSLVLTEETAPLMILLSGSGSQDRDETVAGFGVFKELSSQLYDRGISTFRYDDRGVGHSQGDPDATLQELANDLAEIVAYLKNHHREQFSSLIFLGHSQGGLVATLASAQTEPDALIFMGVPFLRGDKIINQQIRMISDFRGVSEQIMNTNLEFQEEIYNVVRTGSSWEPIEEDLRRRLEEQINQLPEPQRNALGEMEAFIQSQIDRQLSAAKSRWFKSMIEYEPSEHLMGISASILAIFGEKDRQVSIDENLTEAARIQNENDLNMDLIRIPGANHLFQEADTGMPTEYGMLDRAFADEFIATIVEWVNGLELKTSP
ncbi:MAG: alpha/beta fold hydrolase [Balneolaceae bacterium]